MASEHVLRTVDPSLENKICRGRRIKNNGKDRKGSNYGGGEWK